VIDEPFGAVDALGRRFGSRPSLEVGAMSRGSRVTLSGIVVLAVCFSVVAALGQTAVATGAPEYGGTLRFGVSDSPRSLEPHVEVGTVGRMIIAELYNRLVVWSASSEITGDLAESWEQPQPTEYVFHLRQDVTFHNGAEFTAEDVQATFARILDPEVGAKAYAELVDRIQEVTVLDTYTVKFQLTQPDATFLQILASPYTEIVSKAWLETEPNYNEEAVGTGPFRLSSREPGVRTVLERNVDYFEEGIPCLDELVIIPYLDETARVNALLAGEVDMIIYPPYQDWARIEATPNLVLDREPGNVMVLMFNPNSPEFADERVRRAVRYAIDVRPIIDAVFFGAAAEHGGALIPPSHWAYSESLADTYFYDPALAAALLEQADWDPDTEVTLSATSTYGMHRQTAEIVADQLGQVGMRVRLDLLEWGSFFQKVIDGSYEFASYAMILQTPDPSSYSLYFDEGATEYAASVNFFDTELQGLLAWAATSTDKEERRAIYHLFEERLLDVLPVAFLVTRENGWARADYVKGFIANQVGVWGCYRHFERVWLDR